MGDSSKSARLRRLARGLHPYPQYKYHLNVLGPAGEWAVAEQGQAQGNDDSNRPPVIATARPEDERGPSLHQVMPLPEEIRWGLDGNEDGFLGLQGEEEDPFGWASWQQ